MKLTPTHEQIHCEELLKKHDEIKVSAYAGAAKTSTLVMIANGNPVNSLMLTFNRALAHEAKERFPSWVECRTTHSLAYAQFGAPLNHKLKRPSGGYKNVAGTGTEIAKYFKTGDFTYLREGERETRRLKAGGVGVAIKETVARFEQSADDELGIEHVSTAPCDSTLRDCKRSMRAFRGLVLRHAKELWALRINKRSDVLCTHDTYLKLYQLSKPNLSQYEVLYLDECQDTNDVVLDIFLRQQGKCKLVAVGDGYQNIYSWRGAKNAMLALDWPEAKLSKSFRFGQAVGDIADCVLANNGVIQTNVKGYEKLSTLTVAYDEVDDSHFDEHHAILFRTNSALIFHAVDLLKLGKSVNLEIDVSDFVKLLESAIQLNEGNMNKVKHESLLQFVNWEEFAIEAEVVKGELYRVYDMVETGAVYRVLDVLSTHQNVDNPDVTLTTAHKSKGREWDVVVLAGDFPSPYNDKGEWVGLQDMERNLLYVALTRAKKVLVYNQTVKAMIGRAKARGRMSDDKVDEVFRRELGKHIREMEREMDYILED